STSLGGTAMNSGPGKRPRLPMPDWLTASCAAISPMRSHSAGPQKGSTGTKSTVPAMRVLSPSVSNRLIERMPDSPAVSLRQLSSTPTPSEVTMPMPVTTTIGRPALPCVPAIRSSLLGLEHDLFRKPVPTFRDHALRRFEQREPFAAPMADPGDDHLGEFF